MATGSATVYMHSQGGIDVAAVEGWLLEIEERTEEAVETVDATGSEQAAEDGAES